MSAIRRSFATFARSVGNLDNVRPISDLDAASTLAERLFSFGVFRLPDVTLLSSDVDGYVSRATPLESVDSSLVLDPSSVLSKYFGNPVYLVYKGPRPRVVSPTVQFPDLKATSVFQDMYPLLVLSQENLKEVERELRGRVGTEGIQEVWKDMTIVVER